MGSYLDELSSRARLTDAFATLEEPRTIVWIVVAWTWGSVVNSGLIAAIFFWFGETSVGWATIVLAVLFASSWFVFTWTGSLRATFTLAIAAAMVVNTYIHIAMGGYANSGAFFFWGVGVTVVASLSLPRALAIGVGSFWLLGAVALGFLEESLRVGRPAPDPGLPALMFAYTMMVMTLMLVPVISYLLSRFKSERKRAESLLLNVLPETIAHRLKSEPGVIADQFSECTVLFADIVGFSSHTREVSAEQLIQELNTVFSRFDELTARRGAQKIKTIGDGYMAVAGVPEPRSDHIEVICRLGLDMQDAIGELTDRTLGLRVGIHTGPAVAGIIGTSRFSYDLWGATVNLASRMESYAKPGEIQVSRAVRDGTADLFGFEPVGTVEMKGVGQVEAFHLKAR